ncbi:hypothetical protein M7I_2666 [Glarea lozoyensis 74030]|uniref:Uncharacterized protein n=1 Tax=Glarea lozoyensis (strain ATCC 74030 / MF5533) TaxID=1104152 RepID=H0EJE0_GLAL7|nr:hypothetical protein M7I_2666 [Glarea lozoyensis 74030]
MVGLKIDEEEQGENVPLDCGLAVWDTPPESAHPDLDRVDTTGGNKSLEQRFVEAVMHPDIKVAVPQPAAEQQETASPTSSGKQKVEIRRTKKEEDMINCLDTVLAPLGNLSVQPWAVAQTELEDSIAGMIAVSKPAPPPLRLIDYDANAFQAEYKTLPDYKSSIDGLFDDHLELGHRELRKMIRIMDRGMEIIDRDSARPNGLDVENERVLADDGANATSNGAGREEEDGNVDPEDIEIEYSENDLDSDWEIDEEDI